MKIYRDRSSLFLPFLRGSVLTYVGVDNIITGPFRQLMIKYFRLGDFGSNAREEYLYYHKCKEEFFKNKSIGSSLVK